MKKLVALLGTLFATTIAIPVAVPTPASASGCGITFYGVAGSGQHASNGYASSGGPQVEAVFNRLKTTYGSSIQHYYDRYPAADVDLTYMNNAMAYNNSVTYGSMTMKNDLRRIYSYCTSRKFVIVGYSQGAEVAHKVISEMSNSSDSVDRAVVGRIAGLTLIADPIRAWRSTDWAHVHWDASNTSTMKNGIRYKDPNKAFSSRMITANVTGLDRYKALDSCYVLDFVCNRTPGTKSQILDRHTKTYLRADIVKWEADHLVRQVKNLR